MNRTIEVYVYNLTDKDVAVVSLWYDDPIQVLAMKAAAKWNIDVADLKVSFEGMEVTLHSRLCDVDIRDGNSVDILYEKKKLPDQGRGFWYRLMRLIAPTCFTTHSDLTATSTQVSKTFSGPPPPLPVICISAAVVYYATISLIKRRRVDQQTSLASRLASKYNVSMASTGAHVPPSQRISTEASNLLYSGVPVPL